MIVNEKNVGEKIAYRLDGNKIYFGADEDIMLNIRNYERDADVQLNICMDYDRLLVTDLSVYYVAQITIPARSYDGNNDPIAFSMDACTLHLWSIEVPANEV
jgi:hypothetical protein